MMWIKNRNIDGGVFLQINSSHLFVMDSNDSLMNYMGNQSHLFFPVSSLCVRSHSVGLNHKWIVLRDIQEWGPMGLWETQESSDLHVHISKVLPPQALTRSPDIFNFSTVDISRLKTPCDHSISLSHATQTSLSYKLMSLKVCRGGWEVKTLHSTN